MTASARHPWRTLGAWAATLVISIVIIGTSLGDVLTSDAELTNDPESYRAYDVLGERLPPDPNFFTEVVIVRSDAEEPDEVALTRTAAAVTAAVAQVEGVRVLTDEAASSPDGRARLLPVDLGHDPEGTIAETIDQVQSVEAPPGYRIAMTGEMTADEDFNKLSQEDLEHGELYFGLPAALIVLLLVFGAIVAGLLPLLMALVAIVVALALTALVGQAWDLSVFVVNMLSGMGLALGIDYTLFVLSRFREERTGGRVTDAAIAMSGATASRAVVFSGTAYALAMTGLLLVPGTIFRSLALGAILVGITSVATALTLLPAVLALLGDRVNALRLPFIGRGGSESRFWGGVVRRVLRRPALSLAAGVTVLVALALPLLNLETGEAGLRTLPDRFESKQGFLLFEESFGAGTVDTLQVVVDGDLTATPVDAAVRELQTEMESMAALQRVTVEVYPQSRLAVIEALPVGDSRDEGAVAAVKTLRNETVPTVFEGVDAVVLVTGETAEAVDYFEVTERWLPRVIAFVLILSFVLLTVAFRSIVVAAKAILLNLLSVSAAYGLLILVFVEGVGNELFGFQQVETIEAWVPIFLFAVLFGLSMDYHVFLLSRIRERFLQTGDTDDSLQWGVASTARMITGAALIIIAVFAGFARGDLVAFQQMGFGIAVALLIDATLIRSVLVPAAMKLLGPWNWYLPRWLEWLPDVRVEGPGDEHAERPPAGSAAT